MSSVSVTSKGQVTIPKRVRQVLGITPGSKVEFDIEGGGARLKLVKRQVGSCIEDSPAILGYKGPRIPIACMHGGLAMKKAAKRARPPMRSRAITCATMRRRRASPRVFFLPGICSCPRP